MKKTFTILFTLVVLAGCLTEASLAQTNAPPTHKPPITSRPPKSVGLARLSVKHVIKPAVKATYKAVKVAKKVLY